MDDELTARSVLNTPDADVLNQNQFGATLGAPDRRRSDLLLRQLRRARCASSRTGSRSVVLDNLATLNAVRAQFNLPPETTNQVQTNHYNSFMLKLDHHPAANHTLSVRYNFLDSNDRQLPRRRRPRVADVEHRPRQRDARSGARRERSCRSSRRRW